MYARWLLEDSITALNAQLLELLPSLLAPVDTVQPTVTVLGAEQSAALRARAWRDTEFEARGRATTGAESSAGAGHQPSSLCVHVVVASIVRDAPTLFTLELGGLCGGDSVSACPASMNATHLFHDDYSVPLKRAGGGGPARYTLQDYIAPGSTAVFKIGCDGW
eukprot:SAG22_NODE_207_length_15278_cov_4.056855_16_plen_163_part_01